MCAREGDRLRRRSPHSLEPAELRVVLDSPGRREGYHRREKELIHFDTSVMGSVRRFYQGSAHVIPACRPGESHASSRPHPWLSMRSGLRTAGRRKPETGRMPELSSYTFGVVVDNTLNGGGEMKLVYVALLGMAALSFASDDGNFGFGAPLNPQHNPGTDVGRDHGHRELGPRGLPDPGSRLVQRRGRIRPHGQRHR